MTADLRRLRELAQAARVPLYYRRPTPDAPEAKAFYKAVAPDVVLWLLDALDAAVKERDAMLADDDVSWRSRAFTAEAALKQAQAALGEIAVPVVLADGLDDAAKAAALRTVVDHHSRLAAEALGESVPETVRK